MRLIDAEKLFEALGSISPQNKQQYNDIGMMMELVTNSPTVEKRHRGKWILCTDGRYYCQDCHIRKPDFAWDYCPQCGALMVKEGEAE